MRNLLVRKPDTVVLLLAAYFVVSFIVRLLVPNGLRVDESQQAFFSQWLVAGYDTQPPLYNWFQAMVVSVLGLSIATIAAAKNLVLFLLFLSYYKLAKLVLDDRLFAAIATLSLFVIPQVFWQAQRDLTHTVAQMLMINLLLYSIVKTLKAPSLLSYVMIGVTLGLGMLTKYNFTLVVSAALVAVFLHPDGLKRLFDLRFLLALAIAVLIFLPHGLWLLDNLGLAATRTLNTMAQEAPTGTLAKLIKGPTEFFGQVLVIMAPLVAVYAIIFGKKFLHSLRPTTVWAHFFDTIFLVIGLQVLLLVFAIGITSMRDRWVLPLLFLMPIAFCLKMQARGIRAEDFAKRFFVAPLAVMIVVPSLVFVRANVPTLFGRPEAYNAPYEEFVSRILAEEGKRPGLVLTDGWAASGNLRLQLPDVPTLCTFFGNLEVDHEWTAEKPILAVWLTSKEGTALQPELDAWVQRNLGPQYSAVAVKHMSVGYVHGRPEDQRLFGYAWIYPR
ncbi:glycosyltransferase family 39 protein [Rhizobium sp. 3T7]|uniref:glycosyltransferase family 39 protein n=1 Tax=Rhizobium sp. 3T7 TaxID=2874922 RepID=UPI001CCF608F|nr:glycosyltransferase family 39 protein [Rhizobium sp. 3T7]MBZ9792783.1 glycosyltransferase family 39 protein [Rhizobium sp. 3T7]